MHKPGHSATPTNAASSEGAKLKFLGSLALFSSLPAPVLVQVAKAARLQHWPAGRMLFQRGDASSYLIAIEHGHIKISLHSAAGREFALRHLRAGEVLGEIGLLDDAPRTADATAVAATSAYILDRRDFNDLMARHPELALAAIRHLCALVRYTTDHIEAIALYGLEARLARFLLANVRQVHGATPPKRASLDLDLSQSEIADLIGSSRPKVNRALIALEHMGAITRDGRTIRCDEDKLMRAAAMSEDD